MRTKGSLIVLVIALAVLGGALPAAAGDRPINGQITFGRLDPELGAFSIWAANPDGTHQKRLTHVPSFFSDWSPDGRRIAFDFADDTGVHIATMDPNGRHVRQLTFGPAIQEIPSGRRMGAGSPSAPPRPSPTRRASTPTSGSWRRRLPPAATHPRRLRRRAGVLPDGRRIAFGRITNDAEGEVAIYVVGVDGRHLHQVVPPTVGLEHPDWSPTAAGSPSTSPPKRQGRRSWPSTPTAAAST